MRKLLFSIMAALIVLISCSKNNIIVGGMLISTGEVVNVTSGSVTIKGSQLEKNGDDFVLPSEVGVCYSTSPKPTINDKVVSEIYVSMGILPDFKITGLDANSKYYVRTFSKNKIGVAYGKEVSFTTENSTSEIVLKAGVISELFSHSFKVKAASVVGGKSVSEVGLCYSTSEMPTINDNKLIAKEASGVFSDLTISGLISETEYFVRTYAISEGEPLYSDQVKTTTIRMGWMASPDAESPISGYFNTLRCYYGTHRPDSTTKNQTAFQEAWMEKMHTALQDNSKRSLDYIRFSRQGDGFNYGTEDIITFYIFYNNAKLVSYSAQIKMKATPNTDKEFEFDRMITVSGNYGTLTGNSGCAKVIKEFVDYLKDNTFILEWQNVGVYYPGSSSAGILFMPKGEPEKAFKFNFVRHTGIPFLGTQWDDPSQVNFKEI